jgi:hypothetical protein
MDIKFSLEVTVRSPDAERHDVTVQVRDADGITRHMISRPFDFTQLEDALKFTVEEAVSKVTELAKEERK